jgi:hypothetical protein
MIMLRFFAGLLLAITAHGAAAGTPPVCTDHYAVLDWAATAASADLSIRIALAADGQPSAPAIERSSGEPELDQLAIHFVTHCRFPPAAAEAPAAPATLLLHLLLHRERFDEAAIRARYDALAANMAKTLEYQAAHILLASEAAARQAIVELQHGADFATIAQAQSLDQGSAPKGGELGWVRASLMTPNFAAALRAMGSGDRSNDPVRTEFGWHVLQVHATRPLPVPDYASVRERVRASLIRQQRPAPAPASAAPATP